MRISKAEAKKLGLKISSNQNGRALQAPKNGYAGDAVFDAFCRAHGVPLPVSEYEFWPGRKWRFDHCWPEHCLAMEIDGGAFAGKPCPACGQRSGGRHNRGAGRVADMEKLTHAAVAGWRVIFVTPQQVESGEAFAWVKDAIGQD